MKRFIVLLIFSLLFLIISPVSAKLPVLPNIIGLWYDTQPIGIGTVTPPSGNLYISLRVTQQDGSNFIGRLTIQDSNNGSIEFDISGSGPLKTGTEINFSGGTVLTGAVAPNIWEVEGWGRIRKDKYDNLRITGNVVTSKLFPHGQEGDLQQFNPIVASYRINLFYFGE